MVIKNGEKRPFRFREKVSFRCLILECDGGHLQRAGKVLMQIQCRNVLKVV